MPIPPSSITAGGNGLADALMLLGRTRDQRAWDTVLAQAGPLMGRVASRLCRDSHLVEDAIQDALLLVRDHAHTFRPPATNRDRAALGWIMSITTHTTIAWQRRHQRRARRETALVNVGEPSALSESDASMNGEERCEVLSRVLAELPASHRQPIVLHYLGGLQLQDVASTLGIPLGTAKVRIHRGLTRLRERLVRAGTPLSLVALAGFLQQLPASTSVDPTQFSGLMSSDLTPTHGLPPRGPFQELSMVSKFALIAVVVCVVGAVPHVFAQDSAPKAAAAAGATVSYAGKVTSNDGAKLVFATALAGASSYSGSQTVTLTDSTVVKIAGKVAKAADIKPGALVSVVCDGHDVASSVTVE